MLVRTVPFARNIGMPFQAGIPMRTTPVEEGGNPPTGSSRYFDQSEMASYYIADSVLGDTFYVDGVNGSNSYNGLSPSYTGGNTGPFKTLAKAADRYRSNKLVGGDVVKVLAGKYYERLPAFCQTASGNVDEDHRIVIGPYGNGEVIIDASDTHTLTWTQDGVDPNLWYAPCDLMISTYHVAADNLILDYTLRVARPVYTLEDVTSYGKWYYDDAAKMIYVYTDGTSPVAHDVIVTNNDANNMHYGIDVWGDYVSICGLTIQGCGSYGLHSYYGHYTTIEKCTIRFNGKGAFKGYHDYSRFIKNHVYGNVMMNWPRGRRWNYTGGWPATVAFSKVLGGVLSGNIIHDNGGEGVITGGMPGNAIVEDNIIYNNWSVNIYIESQADSVVRRNFSYVSDVTTDDIVSPEDPSFPTFDSEAVSLAKMHRKLYAICLGSADETSSSPDCDNNQFYDNIAIGGYRGFEHSSEAAGSALKNYIIANNTIIMPTDAPPTGFSWVGINIGAGKSPGVNVNTVITNNIVVNTLTSGAVLVHLNAGADESGAVLGHNIYYNPNATADQFSALPYPNNVTMTFAAWQAAMTGQDVNSQFINPNFLGTIGHLTVGDYLLNAGSPAIGSGETLVAFTTDFNGVTKDTPWTVGALDFGSVWR